MWPIVPGPSQPTVIGGVGGVVRPWETRQDRFPSCWNYEALSHGESYRYVDKSNKRNRLQSENQCFLN